MRKLILTFILFLAATVLSAKSYKAEVFKSDGKDNLVELETEDGISIPLENGEITVEDTDIIKARGKGYIIIYLDKNRRIMIRQDTKRIKDIVG